MDKLRIKVSDFQAINKADILLNGITVLTGENSSGKSTLSKLLYYGLDLNLRYESIRYGDLNSNWNRLLFRLMNFSDDLKIETRDYFKDFITNNDFDNNKNSIRLFVERLKSQYADVDATLDFRRFVYSVLPPDYTSLNEDVIDEGLDCERAFYLIEKYLNDIEADFIQKRQNRSIADFFDMFRGITHFNVKQSQLSFFEFERCILSEDRVNNIFSVDNIIYNDSPVSIFLTDVNKWRLVEEETYNQRLRQHLIDNQFVMLQGESLNLYNVISNIIGGQVNLETSDIGAKFTYERSSDGLRINVVDSATGIKQFAILQLLLKRGLLTDRTLLILDEPEAHLHPQWIVEYARVIVLLNKILGVKFMLATHSPDFINALRSIAEKEDVLDSVQMYLSTKVSGTEQFEFKSLGVDVEPIFESFNIALDRIGLYGI